MRRKSIELPDAGLWDEITKTIVPLRKPRTKTTPSTRDKAPAVPDAATARVNASANLPLPRKLAAGPPPLATFDRRTSQKMLRGQADIDARIDLHGLGLEMARVHLLDFLASRRQRGARVVLVITGKGSSPHSGHTLHGFSQFDAPEREGKLRRAMPRWLEEAVFRSHVIGFQPAHPRHGGGGAFYVKLRKWQE